MKLDINKTNPLYRSVKFNEVNTLFNEDGSDAYKDQMLIGGKPTGIANMNTVKHQWAVSIYSTMLGNFWIPQSVDMTDGRPKPIPITKREQTHGNAKSSTRRVIEVQSDLFQKGGIERAKQSVKQLGDREFEKALQEAKKAGKTIDEFLDEKVAKLEPYRNTWHERIIREEIKHRLS